MTNQNFKIYALIDPADYSVFYVGRTSQKLDIRLKKHLQDSGNQTKKGKKIEAIEKAFDIPSLVLLETGIDTEKEAFIREVFWIEMFNKCGAELTNASIDLGGTFFLTEERKTSSERPAQIWSVDIGEEQKTKSASKSEEPEQIPPEEFDNDVSDELLAMLSADFFHCEDSSEIAYVSSTKSASKNDIFRDRQRLAAHRAKNSHAGLPFNHGLPFTIQEFKLVKHLYLNGREISHIAEYFQRPEYSIKKMIDGSYPY